MGFVSDILNKIVPQQQTGEPEILKDNAANLAARIIQNQKDLVTPVQSKFIICNGQKVSIDWPKVILWTDSNGMGYEKNCYKEQASRTPQMFVAHWDVCLSSKSMVAVTKQRGLSVHFGIDNDGTIYQMLDTKDIAWHALGVNNVSCGVEISNGIDLKYQDYYVKNGFGPRPVITGDSVHNNKLQPYLGFYQVQIDAYKALMKALHDGHGIPYATPVDSTGLYLKGVSNEVVKCTFKGMIGHFHVTTNKTDPGYLPIQEVAQELANGS